MSNLSNKKMESLQKHRKKISVNVEIIKSIKINQPLYGQ